MRLPSFFPPFIRLSFGFRSFAGAFFTFVLLGSGEARAELTQAQVQAAFEQALSNSGLDEVYDTLISTLISVQNNSVANSDHTIARNIIGQDTRFWNFLRSLSSSNQLDRVVAVLESQGGGQASVTNLLQALVDGWGYRTADTLHSQLDQIQYYVNGLWGNVPIMQSRSDAHGYEVLVAAPDIEDQLSDVVDSLGSVVYSLDNGIGVSVQGGQLSVDGQVDAYVVNWPDYFTGEYDSEVAGELTGYGQYETEWGVTESDSDDLVQESEDDVDDPAKIADVTNAVFSTGTVLSTNDVDKRLDVRERIFDTVGSQLLSENSLNRSFSSDVLILPAIPQFNLPRLEYSGSNSDVEDFLTRSGRMMGYFWDICFAVFLMFLIWREYEFYFRTI